MRKTMLVTLAGALALSLALPASANEGGAGGTKSKRAYVFLGSVTAVSMDADPATPDTLTFSMLKGNKHARRYVEAFPGDVTVSLTEYTHFYGGGYSAAHDFRVGDGVKVKARKMADGSLVAKKARIVPLAFMGTLVSLDATTATLTVSKANFVGWKYLESHPGSPVSFRLTATTHVGEGEDAPVVGAPVMVKARPTVDGTGLEALKIAGASEED